MMHSYNTIAMSGALNHIKYVIIIRCAVIHVILQ